MYTNQRNKFSNLTDNNFSDPVFRLGSLEIGTRCQKLSRGLQCSFPGMNKEVKFHQVKTEVAQKVKATPLLSPRDGSSPKAGSPHLLGYLLRSSGPPLSLVSLLVLYHFFLQCPLETKPCHLRGPVFNLFVYRSLSNSASGRGSSHESALTLPRMRTFLLHTDCASAAVWHCFNEQCLPWLTFLTDYSYYGLWEQDGVS